MLVHIGQKNIGNTKMSLINYNPTEVVKEFETVDQETAFSQIRKRKKQDVVWLNIDRLHEVDLIEAVGKTLKLHPLIIEDIVNTKQRPKFEQYEDYLYIVLKMLYWDEELDEISGEQVSLLLFDNLVVTFRENEGPIFDTIWQRIKDGKWRINQLGADYLAYTLIDIVVDNYFLVLEHIGEKIEELDDKIVSKPDTSTIHEIHNWKRELIYLRKSVWPLRELLGGLMREDINVVQAGTIPYLRDVYDHTIQIMDIVETFRDVVASLLDTYLSSINNQMNEIMKVLTIISTLFIPPTFIAGWYGMNFKYMPELQFPWGYYGAMLIVIGLLITMGFYFKKKRWF